MAATISAFSATAPVARVKGSNSNALVTDNEGQAAAHSWDQLMRINSARWVLKLEEFIAQTPVVDVAKVAFVKQAIKSGAYRIDAGLLADKLVRFEMVMN